MLRLDELPMAEIERGLGRLVDCFGKPKDLNPMTYPRELQRSLLGWSVAEFQEAISGAIAEERFFPRIAQVRKYRPGRPRVEDGPQGPDICRSCLAHFYYAGFENPDGSVSPRLRCVCKQPSDRWDTPKARRWVEDKRELIEDGYGSPEQEWAA